MWLKYIIIDSSAQLDKTPNKYRFAFEGFKDDREMWTSNGSHVKLYDSVDAVIVDAKHLHARHPVRVLSFHIVQHNVNITEVKF